MTMSHEGTSGLNRRDFLALSLRSTLLLTAGAGVAQLAGCASQPQALGCQWLTKSDVAIFTALAPAVLSGNLPVAPAARAAALATIVQGIDGALYSMGAPTQKALRQLFDLLASGLTRRLLAGLKTDWSQLDQAGADAFLQRWRQSSTELFNLGYRTLSKLIIVSHFATPLGHTQMGYPGPLAFAYQLANA